MPYFDEVGTFADNDSMTKILTHCREMLRASKKKEQRGKEKKERKGKEKKERKGKEKKERKVKEKKVAAKRKREGGAATKDLKSGRGQAAKAAKLKETATT